jgi:parallel beta-helix repeat protein
MKNLVRKIRGAGVVVALAAGAIVVGGSADAATCALPVRYSATSDTTYLTAPGAIDTLSEIKAACPAAPLVQTAPGVWEINSDLVIQGGATLNLTGDVKELRLQSLPSGAVRDVSAITAQYGTINIQGVKVTSWNGTGPDTDLTVPTGGRGRAFIRALSVMEGSTPRASTMNIVDSDLGFLGFNGAESYGVAYKARGCGVATPDICAKLDVLGKEINSQFHDNYMGTYTWGAHGMKFTENKYTHNYYYGLDPHDDSDFLRITGNEFSGNGNHGLICSERCDHLMITNNTSKDNGRAGVQVHGIMLHRGVTDSLIEGNTVTNNRGGGIVVFDSVGNTIKGNTVTGNDYGLRFSVGTKDLTVTGNTVNDSKINAVYTYKGSDAAKYTGTSGRPTGITFTDNTFAGAGAELFKIQDSDKFTFTGGSIAGTRGPKFERAGGHVFGPVTMPTGVTTFTLRGTSTIKTTLAIKGIPATSVKIDKDVYSSATFDGTAVSPTPSASASASATTTVAKLPAVTDADVVAPAPNPGPAEAPPAAGETVS